MAFQKYIHNDPLYVRLGSLLDELDAKLDRALYSKGKVRLFQTRLKWQQWVYALQMGRLCELRTQWDKMAA